jgi:hypothetical protein
VPERWIDPGIEALRPEACQVQSTREEMALLFGTRGKLERRVILPPLLAKQLAAGLAGVMREYEAQLNATPAGRGGGGAGEADVPPAARPMLALVRGLAPGFGFERSFKMSRAGLAADRVILAVRTQRAERAALLEACRALGMPPPCLAEFEEGLGAANTIGFGFEGGAAGGVYKVYLEFWDRLRERLAREPRNVAPALLFLGFKWPAGDPARFAVARYTCHPLLSIQSILRRLEALYEGRHDSPSLAAARAIMALGAARIGEDSFVYVEAAEEGNPRASFDLNFYKARLRLDDLRSALEPLAAGHEADLQSLLKEHGQRPFGHLSGGRGRDGQDFLTVYYEIEGL